MEQKGRAVEQLQWVCRDQAVSRRVVFEGKVSKVVDYFGGSSPESGAQAYLVQQRNYVLRPHLHPVDQFQILYGAPGSLFARWPIGDVVVHYADAFTIYGPLVGGDPPLRYFTLRAEPTDATVFMPEARALLRDRRGRSLHRDVDPVAAASLAPAATVSSTLLADQRDGLSVRSLAGGAGARVAISEPGSVGAFVFVVAGTVESAGRHYPAESVGWLPPGGEGVVATAGADGAALLVLRFPEHSGTAGRSLGA